MSGYGLTKSAQADLRSIRRYYQREAGYGMVVRGSRDVAQLIQRREL